MIKGEAKITTKAISNVIKEDDTFATLLKKNKHDQLLMIKDILNGCLLIYKYLKKLRHGTKKFITFHIQFKDYVQFYLILPTG